MSLMNVGGGSWMTEQGRRGLTTRRPVGVVFLFWAPGTPFIMAASVIILGLTGSKIFRGKYTGADSQ